MIWVNGNLELGQLEQYPTVSKGICLYEVIKIKNSIPLFFDEHLSRLQEGINKSGAIHQVNSTALSSGIILLLKNENKTTGNVRIQLNLYTGLMMMGFIPHHYPSSQQLQQGVPVITKHYEVLLVNEQNYITEGSRSNFFTVKDNRLITAPIATVLPGVTRNVVIQLAKHLNLAVHEEPIHCDDIGKFEAAFLTGTSIGVLPICCIDNTSLKTSHTIVNQLQKAYDKTIA